MPAALLSAISRKAIWTNVKTSFTHSALWNNLRMRIPHVSLVCPFDTFHTVIKFTHTNMQKVLDNYSNSILFLFSFYISHDWQKEIQRTSDNTLPLRIQLSKVSWYGNVTLIGSSHPSWRVPTPVPPSDWKKPREGQHISEQ